VHDVRNAIAIASLHLETLGRLSGVAGQRAAGAAQASIKRASDMCKASLAQDQCTGNAGRRSRFDLMQTIGDVVSILAPVVPQGFEIRLAPRAACMVVGDPGEIYRIIFNLVQNAVSAARNGVSMTYVCIEIAHAGPMVSVRIFDDGPGLPKSARSKLFRPQTASTTGGNGLGIAIARELAERNGASLRLEDGRTGARYIIELVGVPAIAGVREDIHVTEANLDAGTDLREAAQGR
jgi:signal transduction histidine kinase